MQVVYSKITESKQNKRIWIEGGRLSKAGFNFGEAYNVIYDHNKKEIRLELNLFGDRKVSGRKRIGDTDRTPIIDLCSLSITDFVGSAKKVRITIEPNAITISLHHECINRTEREDRFKSNRSNQILSSGTLCVGGGISTAAVHDGLFSMGVESKTKWVVDVNLRYLEVADRNNHAIDDETKIVVGSIEELQSDELEPVDILNVSLPCDIHSRSGKAKKKLKLTEEDESITSVVGFLSILRSVNPSIVISENVVEAKNSASYFIIKAELNRLGYKIHETILDEVVGGSIEKRRRYWFVAVSLGLQGDEIQDLESFPKVYHTVGECLEKGDDINSMFKTYDYLAKKEVSDIASGKCFRQQLVTESYGSVGTAGKHYAKARSTEPRLIGSNGLSRLFTVVESCRMKLIPESLLAGCLFTLGHEIQGQSILYGHGWSLGRYVSSFR